LGDNRLYFRQAGLLRARSLQTELTVPKGNVSLDARSLLSIVGGGTSKEYRKKQIIFAQGAPADEGFYIQKGRVKLSVASKQGKEAVIAILGVGDFFGEGCLAGQPVRMATASAVTDCSALRLPKGATNRALRDNPGFSEMFIAYLLSRNIKVEEDLVDQLFNSSEKRLAHLLLLLANFGKDGKQEPVIPRMSQETLTEMIGTTRSRVSFFMNKFRKLGFINYNDGLEVHSSLLSIVLHD
jgi:CRP/FNR family cyclic AMP-dependent transcriptional regulator